jgi:hypothetical protein
MTTCAHPDLRVEEGSHYCCATCGQPFVAMRVDGPQEVGAVDQTPGASEQVDVPGQISRYVLPDRRLPSTRPR